MIRRRYRILGIALAVVAVLFAAGAFAVSYNSPCGAAEPAPAGIVRMKAVIQRCYGSPEVLRIEEVAKPVPAEDEVLVRVRAASVNPADWHGLTGTPYAAVRPSTGLRGPSNIRFGTDYAGVVEAIGSNVTTFKPGDEVFGARSGSMAEYVEARADRSIVLKPENITFEQAAAIPIAAITALQGLRDKGQIRPGQKVLINGASGGVGTFAVQIAKAFGAEVTGVCSTRNVELVRSLGADQIIDYTKENFTEGTERYDLILDNVGNHSVLATRRALKPDGTLVLVSGPKSDPWIGPLWRVAELFLVSPFVSNEMTFFVAQLNPADLEVLAELVRERKVTPVLDRRYSFDEAAAAMAYLGDGHARAKVVVTVPW
jgi:NADPH:quinone reductase-like Zn-dependent oxidoreductase